MVNNCHAKPDTKTALLWRSRTFSLVCFGIATRLCPLDSPLPIIRHCPAHIIIGRAIQWNMPSGVAGLLCFDAARFKLMINSDASIAPRPPSLTFLILIERSSE
ncbi:hypothetical protein [Candidatus Spongiihabitans sp.]|uniref:hypothetical protein n=1 Tax=Candidatus Spongiihabitans sp. TaxID=3101308 RepID=UPI003C7B33AF